MGTLSLSSLRANVGMTISEGIWNLLLTKLVAWSTGLDSANLAASGVANVSLASKYHSIVQTDIIHNPGMARNAIAGWWAGAWNVAGAVFPLDNSLGAQFSGAYTADHTVFVAPAAMTITEIWTQTISSVPAGSVQLWKHPAGGGAAVALSAPLACAIGSPTKSSGLALAVAVGDLLCWRLDGVTQAHTLPIVVGFSAKVEHRS